MSDVLAERTEVVVTCIRINGRRSLMLVGECGLYVYDTPLEAVSMLLRSLGWETVIYPEDAKLCIIGRLPNAHEKPPVGWATNPTEYATQLLRIAYNIGVKEGQRGAR